MTGFSVDVPDELVEAIADRVASRLLAASASGGNDEREAWRLLDLEEAAARLGRSTRWVRERVKRGELPFVRLDGGALAFEEEDLRAFAESRRVAAGEGSALARRLHVAGGAASGAGSRGARRAGDRRVGGG